MIRSHQIQPLQLFRRQIGTPRRNLSGEKVAVEVVHCDRLLEDSASLSACLEYVVVHEMVHLLEASHNARFKALMGRCMPNWVVYRQMLNRLPVRHEEWDY